MGRALWLTVLLLLTYNCSAGDLRTRVGGSDDFDILPYSYLLRDGALKPLSKYIGDNNSSAESICAKDILTWSTSPKELWARQMHDANGRLPSGILFGHLHALGHFDECLEVDSRNEDSIRGKYCFVKLPLSEDLVDEGVLKYSHSVSPDVPNLEHSAAIFDEDGRLSFNWGTCIPASCTAEEIQTMLRNIILENHNETDSLPPVRVLEKECAKEEPVVVTGGMIAFVVVLVIYIVVLVACTLYDLYTRSDEEKNSYHKYIIAFSTYTNGGKLQSVSDDPPTIRCLHGIRTLAIGWTMLNHRFINAVLYPTMSSFRMFEWVTQYKVMMIVGGAICVDTMFVLSGFLLAYTFFKQHQGERSFNLLKFYIHRLVRLWPAMAVLIFAQATVMPYFGSGPYWSQNIETITEPCRKYWWTDLLFIQNYYNTLEPCIGQLWFLSVDMQLYILSPILLYPLLWKPRIGVINLVFWILVSQVIVIAFVYTNSWGGAVFGASKEYIANFYYYTHMRAIPWMLGFGAGYLHFRMADKEIKMNKVVAVIVWIIVLIILSCPVFGTKPLQNADHEISSLQDGTFNAFARTAWSLSIIWMIFSCIWGYGGPINWFLSIRPWELLGRTTYCMYLVHFGIQFWHVSVQKSSREFSSFLTFYDYLGDLFITINIGFFWTLAFVSPFVTLEKIIFPKRNAIKSDQKDM